MPIYFLVGNEETLAAEWFEDKLNAWVPPEWRPFNFHRLESENISLESLGGTLQAFPMGSDYRVIVLKNISKLEAARKKQLPGLFQSLPPTTVIIFWFVPEVTDVKKLGLGKEWESLAKSAEVIKCSLKAEDKRKWLSRTLKTLKIELTPEAESYLFEVTGGDLSWIEGELQKLALIPSPVTKNILENLVAGEEEKSIFDLLDRLGERKAKPALRALLSLTSQGEAPLRLLAALMSQTRLLWKILLAQKEGKNQSEISKILGIHPYRVMKVASHARNFRLTEMPRFMDWLLRADWSLKTGKQEADYILPILIARMCHQ